MPELILHVSKMLGGDKGFKPTLSNVGFEIEDINNVGFEIEDIVMFPRITFAPLPMDWKVRKVTEKE